MTVGEFLKIYDTTNIDSIYVNQQPIRKFLLLQKYSEVELISIRVTGYNKQLEKDNIAYYVDTEEIEVNEITSIDFVIPENSYYTVLKLYLTTKEPLNEN